MMGQKKCFRGRTFTEIGLLNAKKEALRWECLLNFWEIPTQGGNDICELLQFLQCRFVFGNDILLCSQLYSFSINNCLRCAIDEFFVRQLAFDRSGE